VLLTAPYIHDGSIETLWDVIEFFNKGGERNQFLDAEMKPLRLTESEVDDLANFLVLSRRTASRSYAPRSWIASAQLICTAGRPPGRIYSSAARASV